MEKTHVVTLRWDNNGKLMSGYPKIEPASAWGKKQAGRHHQIACYSLDEARQVVKQNGG